MAKKGYVGIDNVARKVTKQYIGVNNVARKVTKGYIGVNNVARQCYAGGTPVGELEVGSSVYMNVDGVSTEFLVVHQGNPNSIEYDESCNGTWLLMKGVLSYYRIDTEICVAFDSSDLNTYMQEHFFEKLDGSIQQLVKNVNIPTNNGYTMVAETFFLLSCGEIGTTYEDGVNNPYVGSRLDFFNCENHSDIVARRIARTSSGTVRTWWLRDANAGTPSWWYVNGTGKPQIQRIENEAGVRPAIILPSDALVDENFNVII